MEKYKVAFWYDAVEFFYRVCQPDLTVELEGTWEMDDAFREVMKVHGLSSVAGAVFTSYTQDVPGGFFTSQRWDLTYIYSYSC